MFNANSYFLATANLLAFTDHGRARVSGGLLSNTLSAAPTPQVTENITAAPGPTYTGSVSVTSNRDFEISGYVNTSHGRVETTVQQRVHFLTTQEFDVNASTDIQNAQQMTTVDSETTTRGGFDTGTVGKHFSYPLNINYSFVMNPDGTYTQTTTTDQRDLVSESQQVDRFRAYKSQLQDEVHATDVLTLDSGFNTLGQLAAIPGKRIVSRIRLVIATIAPSLQRRTC